MYVGRVEVAFPQLELEQYWTGLDQILTLAERASLKMVGVLFGV